MTKDEFCKETGIPMDNWIFNGMREERALFIRGLYDKRVYFFCNGVDTEWAFLIKDGKVVDAHHRGLGEGSIWVGQKWA